MGNSKISELPYVFINEKQFKILQNLEKINFPLDIVKKFTFMISIDGI